MFSFNLNSRLSSLITGLLIFFVPFFTYLSPANLKQLSSSNVLEIFLALIVLLVVISISSFIVEILMKRFFRIKIILFPLVCFAFFLNFLYIPFFEAIQEFLFPKFGLIGTPIFIFFELFCLTIIVICTKYYVFSIRMILIFSSIMLIKSLFPLISYLTVNIGKDPIISIENINEDFIQDDVAIKRNIYYVILDGMVAINPAHQFNIANKKKILKNLSEVELKYIDKSQSSYNETSLSIASLMMVDYPQKPNSPRYYDRANFFPLMMYNTDNELPLVSFLKKANSDFYWSGNSRNECIPSEDWICLNSSNEFFSNNLFKFSLTTPLPKILQRIFKSMGSQDSIGPFLKYIDKNGIPKNQFFAFIHHDSPHNPYFLTSECEPTMEHILSKKYLTRDFKGYKASYKCALKTIQIFMKKINYIDPTAIIIIQADHGSRDLGLKLNEIEKSQLRGKIFNAIKAPEICFEKYGLPKTNVNTMRFALNCAYGFKLQFRENIHYLSYGEESSEYGIVVERKIYE
jgi:hypothetical protein